MTHPYPSRRGVYEEAESRAKQAARLENRAGSDAKCLSRGRRRIWKCCEMPAEGLKRVRKCCKVVAEGSPRGSEAMRNARRRSETISEVLRGIRRGVADWFGSVAKCRARVGIDFGSDATPPATPRKPFSLPSPSVYSSRKEAPFTGMLPSDYTKK